MKQQILFKVYFTSSHIFILGLYVKGGNFSCNWLTLMGHNVTELCITVRNICLQKAPRNVIFDTTDLAIIEPCQLMHDT